MEVHSDHTLCCAAWRCGQQPGVGVAALGKWRKLEEVGGPDGAKVKRRHTTLWSCVVHIWPARSQGTPATPTE